MIVTTTSSATARPSIWVPMPNLMPAFCHHVHVCTTGSTKPFDSSWAGTIDRPRAARALSPPPAWSCTRLIHWIAAPTARTNEARMAAMPMSAPPFVYFAVRLPKSRMTKNDSPGMNGISQALSRNHMASRQPFISDSSSRSMLRRLR